ncbi:bidirectional sugar transporter SWEET9-like isoform X1 [Rosa rugosa]|uniref:bidirectional sugar transporter SWEET9-like isoform X1 n=1 Tax=Rosa rugosa TaxID=74645 RepID=UPI002B4169D8|nr:bidirectional sugar transporter SWEET9-like isoform X1 [Rosa rugosa]XP_062018742.1 bidirectional sugar transporter SWEET9-like isoform X1 [Rosa rugosa]XP_062018743.1 bidirectional sugar transporter SWEET9-like isoform X1 [Rosa rugosa]
MGALDLDLMASVFGILGTIVAFLVYLAPLPTFYWIFKKKSTQGFPSIPYSVSLFSAMLTLYYAFVKTNCLLLITINSIGCFIETVYLVVFMIYATPKSRTFATKLLILFNILGYGLMLLCTSLVPNVLLRLKVVGWIVIVFNVCVFAAPLTIMRQVIKTKSVEYMSFPLSLSLTLCAVMWFFYGLLIRDLFIAAPNVLGFAFGIVQMIMILVYRKKTKIAVLTEFRLGDLIPSTNMVAASLNDDMTIAIVINSRPVAGDAKKSSETDDDQNPLEGRPKVKATLAAAYGVILRRGSI